MSTIALVGTAFARNTKSASETGDPIGLYVDVIDGTTFNHAFTRQVRMSPGKHVMKLRLHQTLGSLGPWGSRQTKASILFGPMGGLTLTDPQLPTTATIEIQPRRTYEWQLVMTPVDINSSTVRGLNDMLHMWEIPITVTPKSSCIGFAWAAWLDPQANRHPTEVPPDAINGLAPVTCDQGASLQTRWMKAPFHPGDGRGEPVWFEVGLPWSSKLPWTE